MLTNYFSHNGKFVSLNLNCGLILFYSAGAVYEVGNWSILLAVDNVMYRNPVCWRVGFHCSVGTMPRVHLQSRKTHSKVM